MITGINHVTLAVRDVGQSCDFYRQVLGCRLAARWPAGAYLVAGDAWIALVRDSFGTNGGLAGVHAPRLFRRGGRLRHRKWKFRTVELND